MSNDDRAKLDAVHAHLMTRAGIEGQIHFFSGRIAGLRFDASGFEREEHERDEHGNTYASLIAGCERQLSYWRRQLDVLNTRDAKNASDTASMPEV